MQRVLLSLAAAASAFALAPPASAEIFGPEDMDLVFGPDGTISAEFGNSGIAAGEGSDTYLFTIDNDGTASGSVTTNTNFAFSATDLDFISVLFNGIEATLVESGNFEAMFVNNVPIVAGVENVLVINFLSRGNGSYGAQGTFTPTGAIPEPGTWAMMLLGFGAIGFAFRRRKSSQRELAPA